MVDVRNMSGGGLVAENAVSEVSLVEDDYVVPGEIQVGQYWVFEATTTLTTER